MEGIKERLDSVIGALKAVKEYCKSIEYKGEIGEYGECLGCVFGHDPCHCYAASALHNVEASPCDWGLV